ncbi:MAG TPA: hypothetical protein VII66_06885 [Gemmatimonadaceae bacterium]
MTASRRVARTQSQLRIVVVISTLFWGAAVLLAVLAAELLLGNWTRGRLAEGWDWNVALATAVLAGCLVLWRARFVLSRRRVALWMEEHVPSLQYALITASDPLVTVDTTILDGAIDRSNIDIVLRPAVLTPVIYAGVALSVMAGAFAAAHTLGSGRATLIAHETSSPVGTNAPMPNRLRALTVRVTAPAYAGGNVQTLSDPSAVTALVGSRIAVSGSGRNEGVIAKLDNRNVNAVMRDRDWQVAFVMPAAATTISLTDRSYDRVLAIIPIADQPPTVVMTQPTRDTVWRNVPSGTITFIARATDDIGLADGHLEYTVTTGSGEIFKSRTGAIGRTRFNGAKAADLSVSLALPQLALTEGAILSVRAVVSDNNTLAGPSASTSDTRTFRVARADEYDSLAVEAAPPPPMERSLLTERMLIISAESLSTKRAMVAAREYVGSSGRLGADQADLRKKVYGILYEQDEAGAQNGIEGDDQELDPQLVLNRDLKEAYDAMWDAERSLNVGEIPVALPFMSRAARALDRARLADRLYLRGRPPRLVVNVEKVRLSGKEKGNSNVVVAQRARADTASARLDRSLQSALAIARSNPAHFVNSLIRLRAEAALVNTIFATALGDAVDAFRAGADMTPALVRANRALLGAPRAGNAAIPWSGPWGGIR